MALHGYTAIQVRPAGAGLPDSGLGDERTSSNAESLCKYKNVTVTYSRSKYHKHTSLKAVVDIMKMKLNQ